MYKHKNIFGLDFMFDVDITVNISESSIQVFEKGLEIEYFLITTYDVLTLDLVACLYLSQPWKEMRPAKDSTKDSTAEGLFATSFNRMVFETHITLDFLQMPQSGGKISYSCQ